MIRYFIREVIQATGKARNCYWAVANAKLKELENWRINKVYDELDDEKQRSISVR